MSYFKLIPELKKDLNLNRCEWMLFCLILSYPKVMMTNERMAYCIGYGVTKTKKALHTLVERGLVNITGGYNDTIKEVVMRDAYDCYLGKGS